VDLTAIDDGAAGAVEGNHLAVHIEKTAALEAIADLEKIMIMQRLGLLQQVIVIEAALRPEGMFFCELSRVKIDKL
jgi:hypothetical protein